MSTLTFLRKFALRMSLGLSILALPQIAYATQESDDDPPRHHGGGKHDDDDASFHVNISDETLNRFMDLVSGLQFTGSCSNTGGTSLTSLVNAL